MNTDEPISQSSACVVTGGAGALGIEICRYLANMGHQVVLTDIGNKATIAAAHLAKEGVTVIPETCNVVNSQDVGRFLERILHRFDQIHVLINLAGVARNNKIADIVDEDFDLTISSHARGTMIMMRAFIPHMKTHKYGRIINTSSVAALGSIGGASYAAAKGAIEAMTKTAAIELARHGITVNCVAPGIIDLGMFKKQPERAREKMLASTLVGRAATPTEIAVCYGFFSNPESSFVTGQTFYVCGGASLGGFH